MNRDSDEVLRGENERLVQALAACEARADQLDRLAAEQITVARDARERLLREVGRLELELEAAVTVETDLRRELSAARAAPAVTGRPAELLTPATNGRAASAASRRWQEMSAVLGTYEASVSDTIDERDSTFDGSRPGYRAVSRSALTAILQGLAAAGVSRPRAILDLGCGYGRVTRALRAAWPDARLVAADESAAAVAFCVEQFATDGWEVGDYLELAEQPDRGPTFDLIWTASLLSSIDPARLDGWLADVLGLLAPNGVLVAAFHGRDSARRFSERPDPSLRRLAEAFRETGAGFWADGAGGRGTTALAPHWLLSQLTRERQTTVVSLTERGWADHLDVIAVMRRDVHHRQLDIDAFT